MNNRSIYRKWFLKDQYVNRVKDKTTYLKKELIFRYKRFIKLFMR